MAFVLDQSGTYSWPVAYELPVDGGRHRRVTFEVVFRRVEQQRVEQILAAQQQLIQLAQRGEDISDRLSIGREHAAEVMAGWSGVKAKDDSTEDLEFTPANREAFLQVPGMAGAVLKAFGESLQLGKEKN